MCVCVLHQGKRRPKCSAFPLGNKRTREKRITVEAWNVVQIEKYYPENYYFYSVVSSTRSEDLRAVNVIGRADHSSAECGKQRTSVWRRLPEEGKKEKKG